MGLAGKELRGLQNMDKRRSRQMSASRQPAALGAGDKDPGGMARGWLDRSRVAAAIRDCAILERNDERRIRLICPVRQSAALGAGDKDSGGMARGWPERSRVAAAIRESLVLGLDDEWRISLGLLARR